MRIIKNSSFVLEFLLFEAALPAVGGAAGIRRKIFTATLAYAPRLGASAAKFLTYHARCAMAAYGRDRCVGNEGGSPAYAA